MNLIVASRMEKFKKTIKRQKEFQIRPYFLEEKLNNIADI